MRDNTKSTTMTVGAANGKQSSTLRSIARPGSRNNRKPAGADPVGQANGKTPRPGGRQKAPQGGGQGHIARPGGAQKIG